MLGEVNFANPRPEFYELLAEKVFHKCLNEFPLIDNLKILVEIDQITDLILG